MGTLTINGNLAFGPAAILYVTLASKTSYDQIIVSGTTTINPTAQLQGEAYQNFSAKKADTFTIVRCTNTAASGEFSAGTAVTLGNISQTFNIDYTNPSPGGKNIALVRGVTTWTWTGNGSNLLWTNANNWVVAGTSTKGSPGSGDTVQFTGNTPADPNNDNAAGFQVNQIVFSGTTAYTLGGNAIALASGIADTATTAQTVNMAMTLTNDETFSAASGLLTIGGTIDGAAALTLSGPASLAPQPAVTLAGNVGTGTALASLTANGSVGLAAVPGDHVGRQVYNAPVLLETNATLNAVGVTCNSTVDRDAVGPDVIRQCRQRARFAARQRGCRGQRRLGGGHSDDHGRHNAGRDAQCRQPDDHFRHRAGVNGSITAGTVNCSIRDHGRRQHQLRAGVSILADSQSYRAGNGTGGVATADLVTNSPLFGNLAGSGASGHLHLPAGRGHRGQCPSRSVPVRRRRGAGDLYDSVGRRVGNLGHRSESGRQRADVVGKHDGHDRPRLEVSPPWALRGQAESPSTAAP